MITTGEFTTFNYFTTAFISYIFPAIFVDPDSQDEDSVSDIGENKDLVSMCNMSLSSFLAICSEYEFLIVSFFMLLLLLGKNRKEEK